MPNTPRGLHVHSRSEYSYPPPRRFVKNYFEFFGGLQMTPNLSGRLPDPHPGLLREGEGVAEQTPCDPRAIRQCSRPTGGFLNGVFSFEPFD